jgi:hypothetical protein
MTDTLINDLPTEVLPTLAAALEAGPSPGHRRWRSVIVTSLTDAEQVLDHNEAHGVLEQKLIILGESLFRVRWR